MLPQPSSVSTSEIKIPEVVSTTPVAISNQEEESPKAKPLLVKQTSAVKYAEKIKIIHESSEEYLHEADNKQDEDGISIIDL